MTLRQWIKYHVYNWIGSFPYFGVRVHFPRHSAAFRAACEQGIFESENVRMLQTICRPDSYMFDVGAHLGLMAIPILAAISNSRIVSFEPSPNSAPWLKQTIATAGFGDRWTLIEKAVGCAEGSGDFVVSDRAQGLYDGLKHTSRVREAYRVQIPVTTLDQEWKRAGCPPISVIKIDVEGGELGVLQGAVECLRQMKPCVLLEWNRVNLASHKTARTALLSFAQANDLRLYALPTITHLTTATELLLHMGRTESFLLVPRESRFELIDAAHFSRVDATVEDHPAEQTISA